MPDNTKAPTLVEALKPFAFLGEIERNKGPMESTIVRVGLCHDALAALAAHEAATGTCHADRDGDCRWSECPQLKAGEPASSGRHCPLDNREDGE